MEKETVITGDNQAPVTQKATDHIDEELRLAIFKTLKLSQIFFSHFVRISERGSKRHRPGGGGVLPIMTHTRRLRPKGVPFSGFRYMKG